MNLQHYITLKQLIGYKDNIKKIFFYRICGTGMGSAACLLKEAGYDVEGGDTLYSPPMSTYLDSTGIPCLKLDDVTDDYLKGFDLIVVGNSISGKSDTARRIESLGVKFSSFPAAIGALVLDQKEVIGIAGTHGKTTTTYFMAQVLEKLKQKPGYLVGGVIPDKSSSLFGEGKYFPIEADEYDSSYFEKYSKFHSYQLKHLVLTSLEFDHADIYPNVEAIEKEFINLIKERPLKSIVYCSDFPSSNKVVENFNGKKLAYGRNAAFGPHQVVTGPTGSTFQISWENKMVSFNTNVIGIHNIDNLSACIGFLLCEGFKVADVQDAVRQIDMVKRRQEVRGTYNGSLVIDDFAHHPRAVTVTVDTIKKTYPGKKVIVVFEPISATARSDVFQKEFAESLALADKIIIANAKVNTSALGRKDLDNSQLVNDINAKGVTAVCVDSLNDLRQRIDDWNEPGSVLLVLSNRTCLGLWESDFVQQLR